eukprot:EG_transcript_32965
MLFVGCLFPPAALAPSPIPICRLSLLFAVCSVGAPPAPFRSAALEAMRRYTPLHWPTVVSQANVRQALTRETDDMTIHRLLLKALLVVLSSAGADRTRLE